jgi:predicted secreted Zn-dependent protease
MPKLNEGFKVALRVGVALTMGGWLIGCGPVGPYLRYEEPGKAEPTAVVVSQIGGSAVTCQLPGSSGVCKDAPAGHPQGDDGPDYSYYIATAVPRESLQSILDAASPIHRNGRVFYGHTEWHVQWTMSWSKETDGPCKMTKVTTQITANIILPKLVNATPTQQIRFNALLSALRVHELGHYDFAKEAATDIENEIISMPEMVTCAALEVAADDLGNRTLSEYEMKESKYDLETDYGRSQGAWLD